MIQKSSLRYYKNRFIGCEKKTKRFLLVVVVLVVIVIVKVDIVVVAIKLVLIEV